MKRLLLLLGTAVALMSLATTAAFAGNGREKSDRAGQGNGHAYGQANDPAQEAGKAKGKESSQATESDEAADPAADGSAPGEGSEMPESSEGEGHAMPAGESPDGDSHAGKSKGKSGKAKDHGSTKSSGKSADAKHHVIICHRTGSDSNPYVVINISVRGWEHGHTTHPELDGRDDILLKDPASPGEKLDERACGDHSGGGGGDDDDDDDDDGGNGDGGNGGGGNGGGGNGGGGNGGGGNGGSGGSGGVGGSSGGVGSGTDVSPGVARELPFTGSPVWIPLLAGAALLGTGLVLRRRAGKAG